MLQNVVENGLIKGLGNEIIEDGVISLQYANDTILFVDKNLEYAENLKWILTCFELMSGMRINYHKSEIAPTDSNDVEDTK
jgi:hypothetical protein